MAWVIYDPVGLARRNSLFARGVGDIWCQFLELSRVMDGTLGFKGSIVAI